MASATQKLRYTHLCCFSAFKCMQCIHQLQLTLHALARYHIHTVNLVPRTQPGNEANIQYVQTVETILV